MSLRSIVNNYSFKGYGKKAGGGGGGGNYGGGNGNYGGNKGNYGGGNYGNRNYGDRQPYKKGKWTPKAQPPPPPPKVTKQEQEEPPEEEAIDNDVPTTTLVTATPDMFKKRVSVLNRPARFKPMKPKKNPFDQKMRYRLPDNLNDLKTHDQKHQKKAGLVKGTKKPKKPEVVRTGPLAEFTIVVTGEFKAIDREQLEEVLRSNGARVTGGVSGRTHYLVYGEKLMDGRHYTTGNKYKKATELNKPMMDEGQVNDFLKEKTGFGLFKPTISSVVQAGHMPAAPGIPIQEEPDPKPEDKDEAVPNIDVGTELWADKYAPKKLKEFTGNHQAVEKLVNWLKDWEDVVIRGQKKALKPTRRGKFDPQVNINARAALLTGPPGIGKTTLARLVSRGMSYRAIELNASDVRNKRSIAEPLKATSDNNSIGFRGVLTRCLLIMDEVDGMSAGDRGGISALIDIIKNSKIPVICIANDRQSQKLKSLGNHCYDIRFQKPNRVMVAKRVLEIANAEGLKIDNTALENIIESTGNDIRQTINTLEMWARSTSSIYIGDTRTRLKKFSKDMSVTVSNFEAAQKLLNKNECKGLTHRQLMDMFFIDFSIMPLLIHENYLTAMGIERGIGALDRMANAADSISFGDTVNQQIRGGNEWTLLTALGQASSIQPAMLTGNGVPYPRFPEWFAKNSLQRRNERLLRETRGHMAKQISGDNESVLNEYVPAVYKLIMHPIKTEGKIGIDKSIEVMKTYHINPDTFKEHLVQLQFGTFSYEQEFKAIPQSVKSALTRAYNLYFRSSIARSKKKKRVFANEGKDVFDPDREDADAPGDDENYAYENDSEEEIVEANKFKKMKQKTKSK